MKKKKNRKHKSNTVEPKNERSKLKKNNVKINKKVTGQIEKEEEITVIEKSYAF